MPRTSLVVPCFNEESRFRPEAFRTFAKAWPGGVFLLVDDGSRDNTIQLLYALQEPIPRSFEVLYLAKSVGKAEAVRNGFQRAFRSTPDYVAFWDADLATPLETAPVFEEIIRERPKE